MNSVYKLVIEENQQYYSLMKRYLPRSYVVEYKIGQKATAPMGHLYAFANLVSTSIFVVACAYPTARLLLCEAEISQETMVQVFPLKENRFLNTLLFQIHDKVPAVVSNTAAPQGTVACSWIKPLEVIL